MAYKHTFSSSQLIHPFPYRIGQSLMRESDTIYKRAVAWGETGSTEGD